MSKPELIVTLFGVGAFLLGAFMAWLKRCRHQYYLVRSTIDGKRVLCCAKCGKVKVE